MKKMIDVIYKVCEDVLKYKASLNSQPRRFYKKSKYTQSVFLFEFIRFFCI